MLGNNKIIYAGDLLDAIRDDRSINGANFAKVRRHIEAVPAVPVLPYVRGHWVVHQYGKGPGDYTCSCSECQTNGSLAWKCCPVCTAWMNGGAEGGKDRSP